MTKYPNTISRIDYPNNQYQAPVKQMPTYTSTEYTSSIRRATEQAYSSVARLNPFKIIRFVIIAVVIVACSIFAKTIFKWVMNLFGQSGSVLDFLTGGDTGGKDDPYSKLSEEQKKQEAKKEINDLKHVPVSQYTRYLNPKNVKIDRRATIDEYYSFFGGNNNNMVYNKSWVDRLNKLAKLNDDELKLICRYWDKTYKISTNNSFYEHLQDEGSLTEWGSFNTGVAPLTQRMLKLGINGGVPALKK